MPSNNSKYTEEFRERTCIHIMVVAAIWILRRKTGSSADVMK